MPDERRINPDRRAATRLSQLLATFLAGKMDRHALADELVKAAKSITSELPPRPEKTEEAAKTEAVIRLHGVWCSVMGTKAKLTPGRRAKIVQRLKTFTEQQVAQAIRGCAASEFHMGKNDGATKHNSLELICRSDEKLEYFLRIAEEKGVSKSSSTTDRRTERLQREADLALREGRMDDYQRANDALSAS